MANISLKSISPEIYFTEAQHSVLNEREQSIIDLRYGFVGDQSHTLAEIGQKFGITRERVRQIITKCEKKIRAVGRRKLWSGETNHPCAELIQFLENNIDKQADNALEQIIEFADKSLSHLHMENLAIPLLVKLLYGFSTQGITCQKNAQLIYRNIQKEVAEFRKAVLDDSKKKTKKATFDRLMQDVIWPSNVVLREIDYELCSVRKPSLYSEGKTGVFLSKKMNREVCFESGLERKFLEQLEESDEVEYYLEQPAKIKYWHLGIKRIYYPDVMFILKDRRSVLVEIKPIFNMALQENIAKFDALNNYCEQHGFGALVTDGRKTFQQLAEHMPDPDFAHDIILALKQGPLGFVQYRMILTQHNVTQVDFTSLIIRQNLILTLRPFFLSSYLAYSPDGEGN